MEPVYEPYIENGYIFLGHYDGRDLWMAQRDPIPVLLYRDGTPYPDYFRVNGRYTRHGGGYNEAGHLQNINVTRELYDFALALFNLMQ